MRRFLPLVLIPLIFLVATACGRSDDGTPAAGGDGAGRTVDVAMRDIAFTPPSIDVGQGETVRFVFTNAGKIVHDAFIGTEAEQAAHESDMRDGHGGHGGAKAVSVKPGKKATLTHTFAQPGQVVIGCHQPGHYTGGMKITVNVA